MIKLNCFENLRLLKIDFLEFLAMLFLLNRSLVKQSYLLIVGMILGLPYKLYMRSPFVMFFDPLPQE